MISLALASPPPKQNLSLRFSELTHAARAYDTYHIVSEAEYQSILEALARISVGRSRFFSGPSVLPSQRVCWPHPPSWVQDSLLFHFFWKVRNVH